MLPTDSIDLHSVRDPPLWGRYGRLGGRMCRVPKVDLIDCADSYSNRQQRNQEVRDKHRDRENNTDTMQAIKGSFITLIACTIGSGNQCAANEGQ